MTDDIITRSPAALTSLTSSILRAVGASDENARRVAKSMVDANLSGHDSHGVMRTSQYVAAIQAGELLPSAAPTIAHDGGASVLVDGNWTFGQISCSWATDLAIDRAKEFGLATVGVVQCHHTGRVGEWATIAAEAGVITLLFGGGLGGAPLAAPYGGRRPVLGANPIAAGFPLGPDQDPMIVDFATTVVAEGKIRLAAARGQQLAPGSILDEAGRPTTNPSDFYNGGMLLPFGAHKGYALALTAELLASALTGAPTWAEAGRGGAAFGKSGLLMIAMRPDLLGASEAYFDLAHSMLEQVSGIPPAPGFQEVLIPGQLEVRSRRTRLTTGIPLAVAVWQELQDLAQKVHISLEVEEG